MDRRPIVVVIAVVLAFAASPTSADAGPDEVAADAALCGDADLPETGLQGDVPRADQESGRAELGYNCGLALVGHAVLDADGRAPGGNANMAWAGDCAYVTGPGAVFGRDDPSHSQGVAVVDVSDPANPRHVRTLRTRGSRSALETIHAVETAERSVLVVGEYGNVSGGQKPMSVFDVSDCASPRLLGDFSWPENIHNLTISGNGRYVFATQPLQVVDLAGLFDADEATSFRYVGNLEAVTEFPLVAVGPGADLDDVLPIPKLDRGVYLSHEAWPTFDGTKLYLGGQLPTFEVFTILDIEDWLVDPEANRPRVISQRSGRGHSVRTATIGGVPYVLHSEESVFGLAKGCLPSALNPIAGAAEPWLTDISDETDPRFAVGRIGLEINRPEHCLAQLQSGVDASVHYHDVDDPDDTTFVMLSMWNAGLRVVDVRDPQRPREVAYFNPGDVAPGPDVVLDQAWGHVRYVEETGHIWFATKEGGFWVVELEPQVRRALDLDEPAGGQRHPRGRAGRADVPLRAVVANRSLSPAIYCTLGPFAGL